MKTAKPEFSPRSKWNAVTFCLVCFASVAFGADFKTIDGTQYKNVTVKRVEPDGVVLVTEFGISKVYFTELSKELQERFDYHPAPASASLAAGQTTRSEALPPKPAVEQQTAIERNPPSMPSPARPVVPGHIYELKRDYVIGGDTGAVAKRLTKGQRYRGRDLPDGIHLEIDGKSYTAPRDILSAAKDQSEVTTDQ